MEIRSLNPPPAPTLGLALGGRCCPRVWAPRQRRLPKDCRESPGCGACSVRAHCVSGSPSLAPSPAQQRGGENEEAAGGRALSAGGREPSWRGTSRGQHRVAAYGLFPLSLVSPGSTQGSPLFRILQGAPLLHHDWIKWGKCPTSTRTLTSQREQDLG